MFNLSYSPIPIQIASMLLSICYLSWIKMLSPSFIFLWFMAASVATSAHLKMGTVPALPSNSESPTCRLDISEELFGGVSEACGRNLDRSRCCPVLAAWLFAAHAPYALQIQSPTNSTDDNSSVSDAALPIVPDDAQKCANMLESALESKKVRIPQPNATCDTVLCFCGIRLHQIASLSCPAAFNVSSGLPTAQPTAAVKNLENSCKNSSYPGCTNCIAALQKLKTKNIKGRKTTSNDRATKMFDRDCQLMGLTWLLSLNKTAYIPTVSAVLRAMMYTAHPHPNSGCWPDQEHMPLAVDSTFEFNQLQSTAFHFRPRSLCMLPALLLLFGIFYLL